LKRIYADSLERRPEIIDRDIHVKVLKNKISTLIGPRRAGKTGLLYQIMNALEQTGIDRRDMLFESYLELYPERSLRTAHLFLDEIQVLSGFNKFLRRTLDSVTPHIYITGSNSSLLARDIATMLRGRTFVTQVLPLSFKEFLLFRGFDSKKRHGLAGSARLNKLFREFLIYGGYPELTEEPPEVKIRLLQDYFNMIIYKDLVERYRFTRVDILKYLLKRLACSAGREFSVRKVYNEFRSNNCSISKDTIYEMLEGIKSVFFCELVERHKASPIKRESLSKKVYLYDNGIISALDFGLASDFGRLMENLVFVELTRRGFTLFYERNSHECDFIAIDPSSGKRIAIQVVYELSVDSSMAWIGFFPNSSRRKQTRPPNLSGRRVLSQLFDIRLL
jgi:uncharacterized protein